MADLMNLTYRRAEPGDVDACVVRHLLAAVDAAALVPRWQGLRLGWPPMPRC